MMEEKRPRGRPREFDRKLALESALRLFWQKGYEPVSVAELCAAMEISPPSLYAAFGNKSALFLEAARHYQETFWREPAIRLMQCQNIYAAIDEYFQTAAQILMSPDAPCGSMTALSGINISDSETEVIEALAQIRMGTKQLFRERLRMAILAGQIPADADAPALAGGLTAFLEGLSLQARENIFLSELKRMAALASRLLPPAKVKSAPCAPALEQASDLRRMTLLTLY